MDLSIKVSKIIISHKVSMFDIWSFHLFLVKVKSINMIKKHLKPTKENKGGIISKENFMHLSNVKSIDDKKKDKKIKGSKWYQD